MVELAVQSGIRLREEVVGRLRGRDNMVYRAVDPHCWNPGSPGPEDNIPLDDKCLVLLVINVSLITKCTQSPVNDNTFMYTNPEPYWPKLTSVIEDTYVRMVSRCLYIPVNTTSPYHSSGTKIQRTTSTKDAADG